MPRRRSTRKKKRVRGYRYVRDASGRRRRVYRRKAYVDAFGDTVMGGYGGYFRRRRVRGRRVVTGYGAYRGAGSKIMSGSPPTVQNSSTGFIIRHREYIGEMIGSQAFTGYAFSLNPGLNSTFPWLASVAQNFEEWVPRGIIFEYKTMSSDAVVSTNANAGLGTVIMATEYNPYNGAFSNKQQMENYENAKSCKPSQSMIHGVECAKHLNVQGSFFVRTGDVPVGQDIRLYDLGLFQIAAQGMQAFGSNIGELWVSYEIELRKPRIPVGVAGQDDGNSNTDHFIIRRSTGGVAGVTPNTPFGTATVPQYPTTGSTLGGVLLGGIVDKHDFAYSPTTPTKGNFLGGIANLDNNTAGASGTTGNPVGDFHDGPPNCYFWPPGCSAGVFMVSYYARYTTGGADWTPGIAFMNCESVNLVNGDSTYVWMNTSSVVSRDTICTFFVRIIRPNAHIAIQGTTGAYATIESADFYVTQLPPVIN